MNKKFIVPAALASAISLGTATPALADTAVADPATSPTASPTASHHTKSHEPTPSSSHSSHSQSATATESASPSASASGAAGAAAGDGQSKKPADLLFKDAANAYAYPSNLADAQNTSATEFGYYETAKGIVMRESNNSKVYVSDDTMYFTTHVDPETAVQNGQGEASATGARPTYVVGVNPVDKSVKWVSKPVTTDAMTLMPMLKEGSNGIAAVYKGADGKVNIDDYKNTKTGKDVTPDKSTQTDDANFASAKAKTSNNYIVTDDSVVDPAEGKVTFTAQNLNGATLLGAFDGKAIVDDGTNIKAIIMNDQKEAWSVPKAQKGGTFTPSGVNGQYVMGYTGDANSPTFEGIDITKGKVLDTGKVDPQKINGSNIQAVGTGGNNLVQSKNKDFAVLTDAKLPGMSLVINKDSSKLIKSGEKVTAITDKGEAFGKDASNNPVQIDLKDFKSSPVESGKVTPKASGAGVVMNWPDAGAASAAPSDAAAPQADAGAEGDTNNGLDITPFAS